MTRAIAKTYDIAVEYRRHISATLLALCGALVLIYAWNIYAVIAHTVALQKVHAQTVALSASVDALDQKFLDLSSKASPDALSAYGLSAGTVTAYISQTASLGTLATRSHEL